MAGLEPIPIEPDFSVQDPYARRPNPDDIQPDSEGSPMIDQVTSHFRNTIEEAKRHRQEIGVDDRLTDCLRAYKGEYDPETISIIKKIGGTDVYRKLTTSKANDLASWLKDVLANTDERPWDLEPTPIATLPEELRALIEGQIQDERVQAAYALGQQVEAGIMSLDDYRVAQEQLNDPAYVKETQERAEEAILKMLQDEAKERVQKMVKVCEDQQAEGGWAKAFSDFIEDYKIYPNAFVRGPYVKNEKKLEFANGRPQVTTKPVLSWKRVSPFNIFPSPNSSTVNDGAFHEREFMTMKDVYGLIGISGYKEEAIRKVLRNQQHVVNAHQMQTYSDTDKAQLQGKPNPFEEKTDSPFEAFHCYDAVSGQMLLDWGIEVQDLEAPYEIYCMMINNEAVKVTLNADPLGRRHYSMDSFRHIPDSFWGESLVEAMADVQHECNACIRSMVNNLAMSSGPMVAVDVNALPEGYAVPSIAPWTVYQYDGSQLGNGSRLPYEFHDIPCQVELFLSAYNDIKKEADDVTGIPAFVHGSGATEGAGETARGLAMLMDSAAKGIRENIRVLGTNVITDMLHRQYVWNMLYNPDDSIKGDAQTKSKGPLAVIAQQQAQVELGAFLNETNNPVDYHLIGPKRRAALLRKRGSSLNLDPEEVAPSEEEMEQREQQEAAAMQAQQQMMPSVEEQGMMA